MNKKVYWWAGISFFIIAVGVIGTSFFFTRNLETSTGDLNNNPTTQTTQTNEQSIYITLHRMTNTKIIAEDNKIIGEIEITPKKIKDVREIVQKSTFTDKNYLLEVLDRWEKGNFNQVVEEHNYFWDKLDGNEGKASGRK